jgi:hypothetical protein
VPDCRRGIRHRRTGAPDQAKVGIESPNGGNDGQREHGVGLGLVVERAVGLDVAEDGTLGPGDRIQCAQLIEEKILDVRLGQLHRAPAKVLPIVVTGVRTHGDMMVDCQSHRRTHGVWIAGVQSAGHVG